MSKMLQKVDAKPTKELTKWAWETMKIQRTTELAHAKRK